MDIRHLTALSALVLFPALAGAQTHATTFMSGGVELRASLHQTPARPARALAIYLTGNPGRPIDRPSATVEALVTAGLDVFRFNYRGLWGNGGDFTLTNGIADLGAALDYLTDPATARRFGYDPSTIVLVGYSFGTAAGLVGSARDDRVDGIISLAPCDHGYFGGELADPDSEIRDFLDRVTESLFGEGGPIEGGGPVFIGDLVAHRALYGFVPLAEDLLEKKLLFLAGLDDAVCYPEDHFFPLYRRLRALEHPALDARVLGMDHGFSGVGIDALMAIATGWIEVAFPAPAGSGPAEQE